MLLNPYQYLKVLKRLLYGVTLLSVVLTSQSVMAETVMEKITRTGVLTAGTSKDAFPFAYTNREGKLVGYSVDMLTLIQQQIEKELDRKIKLRLVALEPNQRIPQLVGNDVDIVCDASSFTWERDKKIDFSVSYGTTGTSLLVRQNNYADVSQSLVGKRIGVLPETTNELAIKRAEPNAEIVYLRERNEGYSALEQGIIDAFADDDVLLQSWLQNISNGENFAITGDYSQEGIACMIPENNSPFLNHVNFALVSFMQGLIEGKQASVILFDDWFGDQGQVPLTRDLQDLMLENMQLIVDFKEEIPETGLQNNLK